ncbi:MAG TPA: symmetrical bis(5'-nucleosyl)-tetraphosphatase [Burkholderiaceae bacterium]
MTTYAIGDLQGCWPQAEQLLYKIAEAAPGARLVLAGDLVNRGPHSLAALRAVRALGERAVVVLGNHDLHLLALAHGIRAPHRDDTLTDILDAPDSAELLDWLRRQKLAVFEAGHLIVHAGVLPQWDVATTLALAAEVEAALQSPNWGDFLRQMYGNTPARWDDRLQGADRLRCIVNALTRMRFCSLDGEIDFTLKESAGGEAPAHLYPWFDVPGRATANARVVFGHWSAHGLMLRDDAVALDSGCVWGGQLSAVCLEDRTLIQVQCPQFRKPG